MSRPMDFWYKWDYREWSTDLRYQGLSHHSKGILMDIRAGLLNNWRNSVECHVHSLSVSVRCTPERLLEALDDIESANVGMVVTYDDNPHENLNCSVKVFCAEVDKFIKERESALEADRSRKKKKVPKDSGGKKRKAKGNPKESHRFPPLEEKRIEESREDENRVDQSTYEETRVSEEPKPPLSETWPHAHKPQPSPEFNAAAEVYRTVVGGFVDVQPAWEAWQAAGLEGDYPLQSEIADMMHQQGDWRKTAREEEIKIPPPVRFSYFVRDKRWLDPVSSWSAELANFIEGDDEPDYYTAMVEKWGILKPEPEQDGPEVASG